MMCPYCCGKTEDREQDKYKISRCTVCGATQFIDTEAIYKMLLDSKARAKKAAA